MVCVSVCVSEGVNGEGKEEEGRMREAGGGRSTGTVGPRPLPSELPWGGPTPAARRAPLEGGGCL